MLFKIRFNHRGKNYVAPKREAKNEQDAINGIIEQCRVADLAKGKIIMPEIIYVTPL